MTQLKKNLRLMDARIKDRKAHGIINGASIEVDDSAAAIELYNALIERNEYDQVSTDFDWERDIGKSRYIVTVWFDDDEEEEE